MSAPAHNRAPLQVLVVDDSAVVRQVMTKMLSLASDMRVTTAADPIFALAKMQQTRPHVIVLDLEMPRMDGLSFLRKVMAEDPIPVIVCSALAERDHDVVLRALEEGAVDVVGKPAWGVRDFMAESAGLFVDKVRAAAMARVGRPVRAAFRDAIGSALPKPATATSMSMESAVVIAIGASTGGTQALRAILAELPATTPGVLIVQHMPEGFTKAFARDLDRVSALTVREARDGDVVAPGVALLAPGDRHLAVAKVGNRLLARVTDGPRVSRHRPSVDVLFQSVAQAIGSRAVGVILTGMGADGADGLLALREAGGRTMAQDEASCVVFGMPGEAVARGAAEQVVALHHVAKAISRSAAEIAARAP